MAALGSVLPAWLKFKLPKNRSGQVVPEGTEVAVAE
jgi:hypothetical protein